MVNLPTLLKTEGVSLELACTQCAGIMFFFCYQPSFSFSVRLLRMKNPGRQA